MKEKLLAALMVFGMVGVLGAQTPVAVVEAVIPKDWDPLTGEILTAKISESLLNVPNIRLIDRTNLEALFKEQDLQLSGLVTDRDAKIIGGLAGARFIVVPRAARLGKTYFLSARMIHSVSGEVAAQVSLEGTGEWEAFPGLAQQLAGRMGELFGATAAVAVPGASSTGAPGSPKVSSLPAVRLKIWSIFDNPVLDLWIADFRRDHPQVMVEWENLNFGRDNARMDRFGTPGQATLFIGPSDSLPQRRSQGRIQPLGDWVKDRPFDPLAWNAVRFDNQVWGLPLYVGNNLLVYFDKSVLPEAPRTLEELKNLPNIPGRRKPAMDFTPGGFFYWPWMLSETQGNWKSSDQAALERGLRLTTALQKDYWPGWDYNTQVRSFESRNLAYLVDGDWNLSKYKKALRGDLGVAPLPDVVPGKPARPVVTAFTVQLSKAATSQEALVAQEFLKYLSTVEAQKKLMIWAGLIPALAQPEVMESLYSDPFLTALKGTQKNGVGYPVTSGNFWAALEKETTAVLRGGSPSEAAARLRAELQKIPVF